MHVLLHLGFQRTAKWFPDNLTKDFYMIKVCPLRIFPPSPDGIKAIANPKTNFCANGSKPRNTGVVGTVGGPLVPTTPSDPGLLHFSKKLIFQWPTIYRAQWPTIYRAQWPTIYPAPCPPLKLPPQGPFHVFPGFVFL